VLHWLSLLRLNHGFLIFVLKAISSHIGCKKSDEKSNRPIQKSTQILG
jgi:hypothetical protein